MESCYFSFIAYLRRELDITHPNILDSALFCIAHVFKLLGIVTMTIGFLFASFITFSYNWLTMGIGALVVVMAYLIANLGVFIYHRRTEVKTFTYSRFCKSVALATAMVYSVIGILALYFWIVYL